MGSLIARAVIFNQQGQLLMVEQHKNGQHYFALPGGHVDPGETPEQAVLREVREETSLSVTIEKLLYTSVDDSFGNDQRIFLCTYHGGEIRMQPGSIEAQVMRGGNGAPTWEPAWFSLEQLDGQVVYPRGLLGHLREDRAMDFRRNPYKIVERQV